jgi:mannose-6-phosphate isomerase-like protein (cupin superfamily)
MLSLVILSFIGYSCVTGTPIIRSKLKHSVGVRFHLETLCHRIIFRTINRDSNFADIIYEFLFKDVASIPEQYKSYQDSRSVFPNLDQNLKYFIASKLESLSNSLNDGKIVPPVIVGPNQGDHFQVLAVANSERFIRLRGNQTDGRLTMMEGDEYFHVTAGEIEFQIGEERILGKAGTWIFAPRFIKHTFRNINSTGARLEYVFQPAGIEFYFEEVSKVIVAQEPNWQDQAAAVANKYGIELLGTPNWNG